MVDPRPGYECIPVVAGENMFGAFKYAQTIREGSHPPWRPPMDVSAHYVIRTCGHVVCYRQGDYRGLNVVNTLTGTKVRDTNR